MSNQVTVKDLCDKEVPKGAQVTLFGKTCKLRSIVHVRDNVYAVEVPADVGEGYANVPVSAEHIVLTGESVKSVEEVAAEAEKEALRLKEVEASYEKAEKEKKQAALDADRKKSAEDAAKRVEEAAAKAKASSPIPVSSSTATMSSSVGGGDPK